MLALTEEVGLAELERAVARVLLLRVRRRGARVADGAGLTEVERHVDHVAELAAIGRRHDVDARQAAGVGDVEGAVVRHAVRTDDAAAIHAQDDRLLVQRDLLEDLVVGALHEGAVDGADDLLAGLGETGGEADGVLLGDAGVVEAVGNSGENFFRPVPQGIAAVIASTLSS